MGRLARYFLGGEVLHVIQRGNNRSPVFGSEEDYRFYLQCLKQACNGGGLLLHAYVLMTNHVHLLVSPERAESLPKAMQSLGRRYVRYFNSLNRRSGTLWEGRYRATMIDSERYLLTCMRYIELNPVRAGMVGHPRDYPWSSYQANADGEADELICPHSLYLGMGRTAAARQSAYRMLFRAQIPKSDVEAIRESTNKAWALGTERFRKRVEKLSGRRAAPLPRGRPISVE